tara:strand:+ start:956 stop:3610 length:2655 start_codon:yes stop_codon:yes gene_type:complete
MAQEVKIVPNLYTAGNEFILDGEDYRGAYHYLISDDSYWTYATPETGLEQSRKLEMKDPQRRDDDGYQVTPYNVHHDYLVELSRKKYEDVSEVIDTEIKEFLPPPDSPADLTLEERIFNMLQEFQDLKDDMTDQDLRNLIRDAIAETTLTETGFTDPLRLDYFNVAHIGFLLKGSLHNNKGPHIKIVINGTQIYEDDINHTDFRWYNFEIPIRAELDKQLIEIRFDDDASGNGLGDRNLQIAKIKNKQIASHLVLPDDAQAIVPNNTDNPILDSENEHLFNTMHPDAVPQIKDNWNAYVPDTTLYIYDVQGINKLNFYSDNPASYPGMFIGHQNWDSTVKIELPNDWFLSELPPTPVEFTEEDFMIENVRNTKIDLVECEMMADIQDTQTQALADKLTKERDDMEVDKIAAESVRDSLEGKLEGLTASLRKMSDEFVKETSFKNLRAYYYTDPTEDDGSANDNIWRRWDGYTNVFDSSTKRPFHWNKGSWQLKERMTAYLIEDPPPSSLVGLSNRLHSIRLVYNLQQPAADGEGWYQAPQTIGFLIRGTPDASGVQPHYRIKYTSNPSHQVKDMDVIEEGDITWPSNEYQWVYCIINNGRMGENTGKSKIGIEFTTNAYGGGADRDMWVKAMKDDNGNVYYIDGTDTAMNAEETDGIQTNNPNVIGIDGSTLQLYNKNSNTKSDDYRYGSTYNASSYSTSAYSFGSAYLGKFAGKMDVAAMAVIEVPNNNADFWSTEVSHNPWAGITHGEKDDNIWPKLYLYPHQRYRLSFCSRTPLNPEQAPSFNGGNFKCRIFVGDTRNGWVGHPSPWPGSKGYEWSVSKQFENPTDGSWAKHELEFIPIPGPQDGSTRANIYIYGHQGIVNEQHVTDYAEFQIEAIDDTYI